jgi:hypothetical protein
MQSTDPRVQGLRDKVERESAIKPPPMRLVRKGGFGVYEESPVDLDHLPPPPQPLTLRDILDPRRWFAGRRST